MSNKVDNSTQVECIYDAEPRHIVGQEDCTVNSLSNSLDRLRLRKQSKVVRPPLVGAASSTSNKSAILSSDSRQLTNNMEDRPMTSPNQGSGTSDSRKINDALDLKRLTYFPNRNDYIIQKPPEGSHSNIHSSLTPNEGNHDLTRVRSSSSASSVTSIRPLEWDNGADVGYNQCDIVCGKKLDSNMSTVERIALVRSTELLRRSDPEGTTGGSSQQVMNSTQPRSKTFTNKFGHPNAESTPLGLTSDGSPDTVGFISPIPHVKNDRESECGECSSGPEVCGQTLRPFSCEYIQNQYVPSGSKISLFPEMTLMNSVPYENVESRKSDHIDLKQFIDVEHCGRKNSCEASKNNNLTNNDESYISNQIHLLSNVMDTKLDLVEGLDMAKKKMSSSLENISNLNSNAHLDRKFSQCTLPRSQSQTDLYSDEKAQVNENSKGHRSNILIQNLLKNKSASSSSVATVVQKKGDSPKRAIVKTLLKKHSVGSQVCEGLNENPIQSKLVLSENPLCNNSLVVLPTVLSQQLNNKSNYFDSVNDKKYLNCNVDQHVEAVDSYEEKQFIRHNSGIHYHNGIPCKGAHKKNSASNEPIGYINQHGTRDIKFLKCDVDTNCSVSFADNGVSHNLIEGKNTSVGLIDSVESSGKSGTNKVYSVTVEDRVNSFEYLPGHVYENNERHQTINSCVTSSMSIENQTSNNATPEDLNNMWESSGGSLSSTFDKKAQRGADMICDFVKNSYDNDTILKRKLISRVIDKLILKNKIEKEIKYKDLLKNTPWVPPRPSNPVVRNSEKSKSKVPCEVSSRSEKSCTTNTSSDCFIPKPLDRNKCFPSFFQDNSCKTNDDEFSSTSNLTLDKVTQVHEKSLISLKSNGNITKDTRKTRLIKPCISSTKVLRTHNWKEPVTKTEKLIEERKKIQNESTGSNTTVSQLLDMERENQLFWIRSEIDHLSNLKLLLEKQEKLKQSLRNSKLRKDKFSQSNVLKDKNRMEKVKMSTDISSHPDVVHQKSSPQTRSSQFAKYRKSQGDAAGPTSLNSDLEGWVSHQYEDNENIKSCMKTKKGSKNQSQPSQLNMVSDDDYVLYDEPPTQAKGCKLRQTRLSAGADGNYRQSTREKKGCNRRNLMKNITESDDARLQDEDPKNCLYACQSKCHCCNKPTENDDKKKEPLGYYIIFHDPKQRTESLMDKNRGTGNSHMAGEENDGNGNLGLKGTGIGNIKGKRKFQISEGVKNGDLVSDDTAPTSNECTNHKNKMNLKPVFKGGAGELQYHLLHNRPAYVSRAEDRRQCIAQMQYLRELSRQNKQQLLSLSQAALPQPAPTKVQRVFSQQKMRQMTEKKYRQLSEVREKIKDTKKKESYRTNRLMAEVFKKNLQKRVLNGDVNLSNSVFVISSL